MTGLKKSKKGLDTGLNLKKEFLIWKKQLLKETHFCVSIAMQTFIAILAIIRMRKEFIGKYMSAVGVNTKQQILGKIEYCTDIKPT